MPLGQVPHLAAALGVRNGPAHQARPARRRVRQAEQDLDGGGLAGAVWPKQAKDLARLDPQVDPVEGRDPARSEPRRVDLREAGRFDRKCRHRHKERKTGPESSGQGKWNVAVPSTRISSRAPEPNSIRFGSSGFRVNAISMAVIPRDPPPSTSSKRTSGPSQATPGRPRVAPETERLELAGEGLPLRGRQREPNGRHVLQERILHRKSQRRLGLVTLEHLAAPDAAQTRAQLRMPLLQELRRVLHDPGHQDRVRRLEAGHPEPGNHPAGGLAGPLERADRAGAEGLERPADGLAGARLLHAERDAALAERALASRIRGEELEVRALSVEVEPGPRVVSGPGRAPLELGELRPQKLGPVDGRERVPVEDAINVVQEDGRHGSLRRGRRSGESGTGGRDQEEGEARAPAHLSAPGRDPGGPAPSVRAPGRSRRSRRVPRARWQARPGSGACPGRGR